MKRFFCTYTYRIALGLVLFLLCVFTAARPVSADDLGVAGFGLFAGYTHPRGHYSGDFEPAPMVGAEIIPLMRSFFAFDISAQYRSFVLTNSRESRLNMYSASGGLRLFYKLGPFAPYIGGSGGFDHLRLESSLTEKIVTTNKPSAALRAGFFVFIPAGITLDFRTEGSYREMSGKSFRTFTVGGGIGFRFGGSSGEREKNRNVVIRTSADDFSDGVRFFNARMHKEAEGYFLKITSSDQLYPEANRYLSKIRESVKVYTMAKNLAAQDKPFEAIPLYEQALPVIREAEDDLVKLRKKLADKLDDLEKLGIAAYEARDYKRCIVIMRMISAIDPDNKISKIYLPRAVNRDQAQQGSE